MTIETKFNLNDVVYLIHCHRRGVLGFVDQKTAWHVEQQLTLGLVEVKIVRETTPGERESESDNFGPQGASREERYMAYETGIGSGNTWAAEDLFVTTEEATVECERRNALEEEEVSA